MKKRRLLALTLSVLLTFTACSGAIEQSYTAYADSQTVQVSAETASAPTILESVFDKGKANAKGNAWIDVSHVSDGYVAVAAISDKRLKFQVICGEIKYNYDMKNDGTPSIFPLQSGNGEYKFRIMKNTSEKKYAEIHSVVCAVTLKDQFQPFLRPSAYVNYNKDSKCVAKAVELTKSCKTDLEKIKAIYDFVCNTVKYDHQKAKTVQSGYLPTPDETMTTGKGICFDYASLAASMLRSQGIPTKVIFGYVSPNGLYHAWNMFYTKESGWVTVSYQLNPQNWTRMDLTFSANGADGNFIGDGGNYKDVYMY
ncbi:MAG: transglutaminase domain-containing protein [Firmicutes bacterium]|nr:transglutaminase domain-containing protein [Bacillota bacterium]